MQFTCPVTNKAHRGTPQGLNIACGDCGENLARGTGTCKDCRWWAGYGLDSKARSYRCFLLSDTENEKAEMQTKEVGGGVMTSPDFGCNQFKAGEGLPHPYPKFPEGSKWQTEGLPHA
jgi:hypothetical protein